MTQSYVPEVVQTIPVDLGVAALIEQADRDLGGMARQRDLIAGKIADLDEAHERQRSVLTAEMDRLDRAKEITEEARKSYQAMLDQTGQEPEKPGEQVPPADQFMGPRTGVVLDQPIGATVARERRNGGGPS
jgi:hypothetical protein